MIDNYGRTIEYLRLSVTDLCNYRCIYCMPEEGVAKRPHADILTIEELTGIAEAAIALGVRKIRLTGGEPLVRRGLLTLCRNIKTIDPTVELSLTTNGSLLAPMAADLKAAGVDRLNISLDSLDADRFRMITRGGSISDVFDGVKAAEEAGFDNTKLNAVLMKGVNDAEVIDFINLTRDRAIGVRFIELMPIGEATRQEKDCFLSAQFVSSLLNEAQLERYDGVAQIYRLPGHKGTVGLITPLSHSFCDRCNRVRVTADGRLRPCLHSDIEITLRGLQGEALISAMRDGILRKPRSHRLGEYHSADRYMNEIGG